MNQNIIPRIHQVFYLARHEQWPNEVVKMRVGVHFLNKIHLSNLGLLRAIVPIILVSLYAIPRTRIHCRRFRRNNRAPDPKVQSNMLLGNSMKHVVVLVNSSLP